MLNKKIISIFSGIDCLGIGFKNNFDVVLAVEQIKNACETLKANKDEYHPNLEILNENIYDIKDEYIARYTDKIDGIIGGPPCQPYSSAKNQFNPNDERISGLVEYVRWIKIVKPKFFLFENTDGLTTKNKKYLLDELLSNLKKLGYNVYWDVLNSHDYGSVQKRKRVIIIGFREDIDSLKNFKFPSSIPESKKKYVKDIINLNEDAGECLRYSKEREFIISHIPPGGNWKSINDEKLLKRAMGNNASKENQAGGMTGAYRRLSLEDGYCCPTLTTNPCQRNTMAAHPIEDRPLSVREYKRCQGIPESYKIIGSTAEKYKFIGNGVPVEMAAHLSNSIYNYLDKLDISNKDIELNTSKKNGILSFKEYYIEEPVQLNFFM